jgi:hypothetical protein
MAKPKRDEILDAIATMGLIGLAVWTISVPLQWGAVPWKVIAAQGIAAAWVIAGILAIVRDGRP